MVNDTVISRTAFPKLPFVVLKLASLYIYYVKHPPVTSLLVGRSNGPSSKKFSLVFPPTGMKTDGSPSSLFPITDSPFLPTLLAVTDQMAKHHSFCCLYSFIRPFMMKKQLFGQKKMSIVVRNYIKKEMK